jgi:hypothetical protein
MIYEDTRCDSTFTMVRTVHPFLCLCPMLSADTLIHDSITYLCGRLLRSKVTDPSLTASDHTYK